MPKIVITEVDETSPGTLAESTDIVYIPGFVNTLQDSLNDKNGNYIGIEANKPTLFTSIKQFESLCGTRPATFDSKQLYTDLQQALPDGTYTGFGAYAIPYHKVMFEAGQADPSYIMAKEYLSAGLNVLYERVNQDPEYNKLENKPVNWDVNFTNYFITLPLDNNAVVENFEEIQDVMPPAWYQLIPSTSTPEAGVEYFKATVENNQITAFTYTDLSGQETVGDNTYIHTRSFYKKSWTDTAVDTIKINDQALYIPDMYYEESLDGSSFIEVTEDNFVGTNKYYNHDFRDITYVPAQTAGEQGNYVETLNPGTVSITIPKKATVNTVGCGVTYTADGVTDSYDFVGSTSPIVVVDGVTKEINTDYTVSQTTITFVQDHVPTSGQIIQIAAVLDSQYYEVTQNAHSTVITSAVTLPMVCTFEIAYTTVATDPEMTVPGEGDTANWPQVFAKMFSKKTSSGYISLESNESISNIPDGVFTETGYGVYRRSNDISIVKMYSALEGLYDSGEADGLIDKGNYSFKYLTSGGYPVYEYNNNSIVNAMMQLAQKRGDCVAFIDHTDNPDRQSNIDLVGSVYNTVSNDETFMGDNSDFATMFTPWASYVRTTTDKDNNGRPIKSSSFRMPASYAYFNALGDSIQTNANWLAIAGSARGVVENLAQNGMTTNIPNGAADAMQPRNDIAVNAITNIKPYGWTIWGNRTLKNNAVNGNLTATSFLNIRNLVSDVKKTAYKVARQLTFEQNNDILWVNFKGLIAPTLDRMLSGYGISGYKIIRDYDHEKAQEKATVCAQIILHPVYAVEDFYISVILRDDEIEVE